MKKFFIFILFLAYQFSLVAQQNRIDSFIMDYEGQSFYVTQDIDFRYWGTYKHEDTQHPEYSWEIVLTAKDAYLWKKSKIEAGAVVYYKFQPKEKKEIQWGALIENGQLKTTTVKDYGKNGVREYPALVVLVYYEGLDSSRQMLLYEKQGAIMLHNAKKEIYMEYYDAPISGR